MNITERIREARRKSKDATDQVGIWPFVWHGFWKGLDRSAIEHDQCYLRVQAGVTDETIADCDRNLKANLKFYARGDWLKLLVTALACGVVEVYSRL